MNNTISIYLKNLYNNLRVNFKVISSNKLLYTLFIFSQIACCIALLFSTMVIMNMEAVAYGSNTYTITLSEPIEYVECVSKLSTVESENCMLVLDENKIFITMTKSPYLVPNLGKSINLQSVEAQAVVGDMEGRPNIGEYVYYDGMEYKVVGHTYQKNIIELSANNILPSAKVFAVNIFGYGIYKKDIASYKNNLQEIFARDNVQAPNPM